MRSGIGNSAQDPIYITGAAAGTTLQDGSTAQSLSTNSGPLPAGTDRSGTANTTASSLAAANTARRGLEIQNVGANNIGVNEIGGTAAIGATGTYTITPGSSFKVRTSRAISVVAATGATIYSATEY